MKSIGIIGFGTVGKALSHSLVTNSLTQGQVMSVFNYDIKDPHKREEASLNADIVFICLPTQIDLNTERYDLSVIQEYISKINKLSIIAIRTTVLPGDINFLKNKFPDHNIVYFPDFISESNSLQDAKAPERYIFGCSNNQRESITKILSVMPRAKNIVIVSELEAEWIKQLSNFFGTMKLTVANMFFDFMSETKNFDIQNVLDIVGSDTRIGKNYLNVSGEKRGAGGKCLIKDTAALKGHSKSTDFGKLVQLIHENNIDVLLRTNKDPEHVQDVYLQNKPHSSLQ